MIKPLAFVAAFASLAACLAAPVLYFAGRVEMETYKTLFLIASVAWFVAATVYDAHRKRQPQAAGEQR